MTVWLYPAPDPTPNLRRVREQDRRHLIAILYAVTRGSVTRSDTQAMLMMMRGEAPRGSVLRDIADSVAHDKRDRGPAWTHLRAFTADVALALTNGERLPVPVLYPIDAIVTEIIGFCSSHQIPVVPAHLSDHKRMLADAIAEVLDGVRMEPPVAGFDCQFVVTDGMPAVQIQGLSGQGHEFAGLKIMSPLLYEAW